MADLDQTSINTIRFLAVDSVEKAKSGHPGLPLGAAPMAYVLWDRFLRDNPADPHWPNRDRFLLSAGHGSALLYALLHLTGYDLPLEELQRFRQWGSRTPGHPEVRTHRRGRSDYRPLGQGFAMGVGMAIAERHLASTWNSDGATLVDHYTYGIVSDGDLMEGISSEAASLAGTLGLGKLIYLYDDNHVSLEGPTEWAFTEDVAARFAAYGWQVLRVPDGNDLSAIDAAIREARAETRSAEPHLRSDPPGFREPGPGYPRGPRATPRTGQPARHEGEAGVAPRPALPHSRRGAIASPRGGLPGRDLAAGVDRGPRPAPRG